MILKPRGTYRGVSGGGQRGCGRCRLVGVLRAAQGLPGRDEDATVLFRAFCGAWFQVLGLLGGLRREGMQKFH